MYHLIRATGHAEGWSYLFYFFTFIRGILFFTVVVLIGTGWSYLKVPYFHTAHTHLCLDHMNVSAPYLPGSKDVGTQSYLTM